MSTIFYKKDIGEKTAFINPRDLTQYNPDFPKLWVSTFNENIIIDFAEKNQLKIIGYLYSVNGKLLIYEYDYNNNRIAVYLSKVGAPALLRRYAGRNYRFRC